MTEADSAWPIEADDNTLIDTIELNSNFWCDLVDPDPDLSCNFNTGSSRNSMPPMVILDPSSTPNPVNFKSLY